ncbi:MAG: RHS domain-containing protein [Candidatus Coatesbacteria bacterium]|nr:MAG: RHS domain-containing protein [Candidatus Coatesbacteria bacterium]
MTTKRYEYIYGKGRKLAKIEYEGDVLEAQVYYYHNDLLGSPVCVTDIDGNVAWKGDYLPFGEPLQDIDTVCWGNAYTYLGNEDDGGLKYSRARYYDDSLGRFMSCDPIKDMASSALTINPYVYCGNNPIVFKDPLGLKAPGPIPNPDAGGRSEPRLRLSVRRYPSGAPSKSPCGRRRFMLKICSNFHKSGCQAPITP